MKKIRLIVALAFILGLTSLAFAGGPNDVRREDRQQDKNAQQNDKK